MPGHTRASDRQSRGQISRARRVVSEDLENRAPALVRQRVQHSALLPVSIYNAVGESGAYFYFYGHFIGLEVLLRAFTLRSAWTWPRRTTAPATLAGSLDREALRTPQQA